MAVAYDSCTLKGGYNVSTVTTDSFTIGAGSNRAALVCCHQGTPDMTGYTWSGQSCGGAALSELQLYYANYNGVYLFGCVNPSSGSQTATLNWNSASGSWAYVGVQTFDGVDQDTPFDGIQTATTEYNADPVSVTVTSASGDLTASFLMAGTACTTNQTEKYENSGQRCADIGPGTGNTTHTWSKDSGSHRTSLIGVNVNQAGAGGATVPAIGASFLHQMRGGVKRMSGGMQ